MGRVTIMINAQDKILKTLDTLILHGQSLSPSIYKKDFNIMTDEHLDHARYTQWNTQCLNLLSQIKTGKSVHFEKFLEEENKGYKKHIKSGREGQEYHSISVEIFYKLAVLRALKEDVKSGNFFDEELLITADAFDSILGQAEYLLDGGYKDAAAVLIGAVLESTLRKLCDKNGVTYGDNPKMNSLNDSLKDKAYNALIHKQIIAWADLRNNAAHGHFDKYDKRQVQDMFKWTRDFIGNQLS